MSAHFTTLWDSLEFVAKINRSSCSRLAINGGLDPTTFNRSKRVSKYKQEHWISVGSLIKALNGADMSMLEFAVIFQIIHTTQNTPRPEHVKAAICDINHTLQQHLTKIQQATS